MKINLESLSVRPVTKIEEPRYLELMQQHHYLGDLAKIGHTLWYVATYGEAWATLLSFSAAAWKCAARDRWIGWSYRHQYSRLNFIAVLSEDGQEVRLFYYSEARGQKEEAMAGVFVKLLKSGWTPLSTVCRPRTEKRITKLWERIDRLKDKAHGIGQHYHIELQADESGTIATALTWTKQPRHPSRRLLPTQQ